MMVLWSSQTLPSVNVGAADYQRNVRFGTAGALHPVETLHVLGLFSSAVAAASL